MPAGRRAETKRAERATRIGTFVSVGDASLAEALGSVFDVLVVDLEHGSLDVSQAQILILAIQASGAAAYVRVASVDDPRLAAVLDAGADGVVSPMVETQQDAAAFARRVRYPPSGRRSYGPRRVADYGRSSALDGPDPVCGIQIETRAAIDAAPEICGVEGIGLVVVGCSDLSVSLGTPLALDTDELRGAIARASAVATSAGVPFGLAFAGDVKRLGQLTDGPVDLLLHGVDLRIYLAAADALASTLREVTAPLPAGVGLGHETAPPSVQSDGDARG